MSLRKTWAGSRLATVWIVGLFVLGGAGCAGEVSKAAYEERMEEVFEEVAEKSAPIQKELSSLGTAPTDADKEKAEDLKKDQIEILEKAAEQIEGINPPDDFFTGHSMVREFLTLLVVSLKAPEPKPREESADEEEAILRPDSETLESLNEATQAYARASQELPFLDRELRAAFNEILSWAQRQIYR